MRYSLRALLLFVAAVGVVAFPLSRWGCAVGLVFVLLVSTIGMFMPILGTRGALWLPVYYATIAWAYAAINFGITLSAANGLLSVYGIDLQIGLCALPIIIFAAVLWVRPYRKGTPSAGVTIAWFGMYMLSLTLLNCIAYLVALRAI